MSNNSRVRCPWVGGFHPFKPFFIHSQSEMKPLPILEEENIKEPTWRVVGQHETVLIAPEQRIAQTDTYFLRGVRLRRNVRDEEIMKLKTHVVEGKIVPIRTLSRRDVEKVDIGLKSEGSTKLIHLWTQFDQFYGRKIRLTIEDLSDE